MSPTPPPILRSIARGTAAVAIAAAAACAGTAVAAGGSTPLPRTAPAGVLARAAVTPVPGEAYAPPGTSITFRGVTPAMLRGLSVVGSVSGRHLGTVRGYPGAVAVFTPARPFAGGERVTVRAPALDVAGVAGAPYSFVTARPAPPAAAAAALRLAAATDSPGSGSPTAAAPRATTTYTPPACPTQAYRSAPALHAQTACMNAGVVTHGTEPGTFLFLTPGLHGAGIYGDNGDLVWWQGATGGQAVLNESVVQYQGTPYLAVWSGEAGTYGKGEIILYDEHYQVAGVITAGVGFAGDDVDLHEFQITPAGDALVGIYEPVEITSGSTTGTVLQYVVRELSLVQDSTGIHTGAPLFEWDSLLDVPISQSYEPGTAGGLFDYFHGNAISQEPDNGDLIVSSRNTWGLYELDTNPSDSTTYGHVLWEVGAKGDTTSSPEPWCYQHDVVALGGGRYSLFDDGGAGPSCAHASRGLIFTVTPPGSGTPATVKLVASYEHSPDVFAGFTGSTQVLSNGNVVVDWANIPAISEYSPTGSPLMDLSLASNSYRGVRSAWVGEPLTPPSAAVTTKAGVTTVYASWNGSTQVTGWRVLGGSSPSHLVPVSIPYGKTGFETAVPFNGVHPYLAVEALDPSRNVLATTPVFDTAGYVVAASTGAVTGGGDAAGVRSPAPKLIGTAAGIAEVPGGGGYWLAGNGGGVFTYGNAPFHGSAAGQHLKAPVVGIAASPAHGYWLVASDGGIFAFGNAPFRGSAGGLHLNRPIVGMAPTPDGYGYWLVASDGGIFTYGDARFHGSAGNLHLTSPVVGMAATADGGGYWLFVADGRVLPFGDAHGYASPTASQLGGTVVAAGAARDHDGYWLVSSTGRVLGFGDAPSYGAVTPSSVRVAGIAAA